MGEKELFYKENDGTLTPVEGLLLVRVVLPREVAGRLGVSPSSQESLGVIRFRLNATNVLRKIGATVSVPIQILKEVSSKCILFLNW